MAGGTARHRSGDDQQPVLALDIGGTKLAAAVVTLDGTAHAVAVEPTHREQGWHAVLHRLFAMAHTVLANSGFDAVHAVGIACGGPLAADAGVLLRPPHLPDWVDVPIGRLAAEEFGVPSALRNDATAAAIAEHRFGAGRGSATMLYLTVSTGIGGGAIINDTLYLGSSGNGCEFGHVTVRRGGRLCGCGRRGCVEAYASGTSIALRAREALADGTPSSLAGLAEVTAADVVAAAADGDPLATAVWAETVDLLGSAITDLVNVFEPDLVVLGGGVTRAGAMLLDPVRGLVNHEAMPPAARAARVVLAGLHDLVGVVGAGVVAHDLLAGERSAPIRATQGEKAHV